MRCGRHCHGDAVLAAARRQADRAPTPTRIKSNALLYSAKAHGIYASDMEKYFKEKGFRTFTIRGEWEDLSQQLDKGRPLIVALQPAHGAPLHYVVVAGSDQEQGIVMLNDPAQRKLLKQDRPSFEREWSAAGKWTLLALPQTDLH